MRTESRNLFTFGELSDKAKERALDLNRDWDVEGLDWWQFTYEAAKRIGLKITSFDLGRRSECSGQFTRHGKDSAQAIFEEHGPDCETVATAKAFLKDFFSLELEDETGEPSDRDLEECEKHFLQSLLEDYRIMLGKEYEWLTSDDQVAEFLECNEVEFLEDGSWP